MIVITLIMSSIGKVITLSNNSKESDSESISVSSNTVYMVWREGTTRQFDILFANISDNGESFSESVTLNVDKEWLHSPQVSSFENYVYVVWVESKGAGGDDHTDNIIFVKSPDGGERWSNPIKVNAESLKAEDLVISSFDNNIYVAWREQHPRVLGSADLFFVRSPDGGERWSNPIKLTKSDNDSGRSFFTDIASGGSNVYLAWKVEDKSDGDSSSIIFTKSTDNGKTFSETMKLGEGLTEPTGPILSSSSNNKDVFAIWTNSKNEEGNELIFTKSTDGGNTFNDPVSIYKSNNGISTMQLCNDNNNSLYVLIDEYESNGLKVIESKDKGDTFEEPYILSDTNIKMKFNTMSSDKLPIIVNNNNIYGTWSNNGQVLFQKIQLNERSE
jgi:hypothetical protein